MKKIMTVIAAITLLSVFNRAYADTGIELVKYDVSNQEETTVVIGENQYNGTEMPAYIPATVADMDLTGINNAPSAPDSIIGLDDRERLSETQVAVHPYSTVLLLLVGWDTDSNGTVDYYGQGTGTMVGPNTILTAGHCIYKQESGWPDELRVYPFVSSSSLNGKTYYSAIYAVAICDNKSVEEVANDPHDEVLERYRELKEEGRIAFTTFHQSYGYEEFIEGIKPKLNIDSDSIGYTIEDGVFKEFCKQDII